MLAVMVGYYQWSTYYWLSKELSMVKIHGRASIKGGMSSWGSFPSLWVIGEELGFVMIYGVGSCCCMSPNRFLRRARVVSKSEIRKALHLFYHHHHFKIQMTVGVNYFLSHLIWSYPSWVIGMKHEVSKLKKLTVNIFEKISY